GQTNTKAEESSVNEALEMATERGVYTTKLLTMCYAQLAYTHGTILPLLYDEGMSSDEQVTEHATQIQENLKLADKTFKSLENHWASRQEKLDLQFRIDNAQGYGHYRLAFFREK